MNKFEIAEIVTVYAIMIVLGGLNFLDFGVWLTPLFVVLITLLPCYGIYQMIRINPMRKPGLLKYASLTVLIVWITQAIGAHTSLLFGNYDFGTGLVPLLFDTPLCIGFIWLAILLSSWALAERITFLNFDKMNVMRKSLIIGLFMTIMDFFLEPVASVQNFWRFSSNFTPLENYLTWFVIGSLLALLGFKMDALKRKMPRVLFHSWFAMIIYFELVYLAKEFMPGI